MRISVSNQILLEQTVFSSSQHTPEKKKQNFENSLKKIMQCICYEVHPVELKNHQERSAAATPAMATSIAIMLGPNVYISMLISIDYSQYGMNTCDSWFP